MAFTGVKKIAACDDNLHRETPRSRLTESVALIEPYLLAAEENGDWLQV